MNRGQWTVGPLELCTLSLFGWGSVSTAGDRAVGLALQGILDDVGEDLCGSCVALVLHAVAHSVSIDDRGTGVALYLDAAADFVSIHGDGRRVTGNLQAATDGVARTGWRTGADEDGSAIALDHQATGDRAAADLVGSSALGQARDGEVALDGGGRTDGEGAAAGDGDAASDGGSLKNESAAAVSDGTGCAATQEDTDLALADDEASFEGTAVRSIASGAG